MSKTPFTDADRACQQVAYALLQRREEILYSWSVGQDSVQFATRRGGYLFSIDEPLTIEKVNVVITAHIVAKRLAS